MKYKLFRISRIELYEEIWSNTLGKTAQKYDVPYDKMKKACCDANIPLPTNSYWSSIQMGMADKVIKLPLPESNIEYVELQVRDRDFVPTLTKHETPKIDIGSNKSIEETKVVKKSYSAEILSFLDESERGRVLETASQLCVSDSNKKFHKVINKHQKDVQQWIKSPRYDPLSSRKHDSWWKRPDYIPVLCESVSVESLPRIYCLINALFSSIEKLGGKVNDDLSVTVRGEKVEFYFSESQKQAPHAVTPEEKRQLEQYEQDKAKHQYAYMPKIRKYDYISTGQLSFKVSQNRCVRDSNDQPIESRLGDMLISIYEKSEIKRLHRLEQEEKERKRQEEQRKKEELRQLYNDEVDKFERLQNEAADFEAACRIRSYANAILSEENLSDERRQYAEWALKKADWLDPTIESDDEYFGKRKHGEKIEKLYRYF